MSVTITIPDDLIEIIKTQVTATPAEIEQFFVDAARNYLRELRAKQLHEAYERAHAAKLLREVYRQTITEIKSFESKYHMSSEQFLKAFESGAVDEDPDDWMAFYRWRNLVYSLRRMEEKYGLTPEAT